jgi:hypothetical protein
MPLDFSSEDNNVSVALIHRYIWKGKHKHPKAASCDALKILKKSSNMIDRKLFGYDVIVYGDNHKGFLTKVGETFVLNCGTLMRRRSPELGHKPQVGLLYESGDVRIEYLDTSQDIYLPVTKELKTTEQIEELDMELMREELDKLDEEDTDFKHIMRSYLREAKVLKKRRDIIYEAMRTD